MQNADEACRHSWVTCELATCGGPDAEALRVIDDGVLVRRPALWDGRAGERIADVLLDDTRPRR